MSHALNTHSMQIEAAILEALPLALVRMLCGPLLKHLEGDFNYERWCLTAARDDLNEDGSDIPRALGYIRAGLAQAIQPGHVEPGPETILLQAAFWLLSMQAQGDELTAACAAGELQPQERGTPSGAPAPRNNPTDRKG